MRSSSGGTLRLICEIGGTARLLHHASPSAKSVSPRKRRCPASSSQRMMPTAKMSVRVVDLLAQRRLGREVAELALDDAGLALLELARRLGEAEVHDLDLAVLA